MGNPFDPPSLRQYGAWLADATLGQAARIPFMVGAAATARPERPIGDYSAVEQLSMAPMRDAIGAAMGSAEEKYRSAIPFAAPVAEAAQAAREKDPSLTPLEMIAPGPFDTINAMPMALFHGTPHRFDRFDMGKVGTGQGAASYGHGIYLAESRDVANRYHRDLTRKLRADASSVDGAPFDIKKPEHAVAWALDQTDGNKERALRHIKEMAGDYGFDEASLTELLNREAPPKLTRPGGVYDVTGEFEPEDLLDWDLPLNQQPQAVQEAMKKLPSDVWDSLDEMTNYGLNPITPDDDVYTAGEFIRALARVWDGDQEAVSDVLREVGINGTRYLDQYSRAKTGGKLVGVEMGPAGWTARIKVDRPDGNAFEGPEQMFTTSKPFATEAEARKWADEAIGNGTRNVVWWGDPERLRINSAGSGTK